MKKLYFIFAIAVSSLGMNAQSLTPTVIASTGGFSSNANGSLSYTVGEMTMVQTFSANNNILTQGFQQPNEFPLGLIDITQDDFGSFAVYPNPAVDVTNFGFQMPEAGRVTIAIYDELGQKVSDIYAANYENGKITGNANVSSLSAALYFVTLTFVGAQDGKTHITTKKLQVIR
jgi:type IX secretion system substrate protein